MRKFYTCPIIAAYMARYFEIKYIVEYEIRGKDISGFRWKKIKHIILGNFETILSRFINGTKKKNYKIYIAEESLPIFEPKEDDIGQYIDDEDEDLTKFARCDGEDFVERDGTTHPAKWYKIIKRNNLHFFQPQEENDKF